MSTFTRHPWTRWAVPSVAVLAVGAATLAATVTADASTPLPPRTAAQLLVDVRNAKLTGLSGTVVQTSNLGLPSIPGLSTGGGVGSSSDLTSLVSGTHTLRVWYGGESQQRVALLGSLGESDVIRNGSSLWTWSSRDKTATHYTLPATGTSRDRPDPTTAPLTPDAAARQALAAINPTTKVSTEGTARVAGRPAYELVLAPRQTASLVDQVRIAVDSGTHIPLRVQVYSTKTTNPAFQIGFTQVDFGRPQAQQFTFNPPPGTTVKNGGQPFAGSHPSTTSRTAAEPRTVGTGWTTVVVGAMPKAASVSPDSRRGEAGALSSDAVLKALPKVSGRWGTGRLFAGTLVSVVVTDDGRVAVGAVAPDRLYAALAAR